MMPARKPADLVTFTHGCGTFKTRPANAHKVRAALDALKPGMTTADYIQQFHSLNDIHKWAKVQYVHADRAAPMLDPLVPEVLEEPDADYVVPTVAAKPRAKRQTYSLAEIRNGTGWPEGARFQLVAA